MSFFSFREGDSCVTIYLRGKVVSRNPGVTMKYSGKLSDSLFKMYLACGGGRGYSRASASKRYKQICRTLCLSCRKYGNNRKTRRFTRHLEAAGLLIHKLNQLGVHSSAGLLYPVNYCRQTRNSRSSPAENVSLFGVLFPILWGIQHRCSGYTLK